MLDRRRKSDVLGTFIKLAIVAIIWYSECIQQRFLVIDNFLLYMGCAMLGFVILDLSTHPVQFRSVIPAPCWWLLGFFTYMIVIPSIFAVSFSAHLSQWITSFEYVLVMLCIIYLCRTRDCASFFITNYALMYLFMCVVFLISPMPYKNYNIGRYSFATEMNPNGFAVGLSTGVFAILYLVSRKKIPLLLGFSLTAVFIYAILMTGSRKGLIGAVACVVMWICLCYIPAVPRRQILKKAGRFLFVIVLAIIALYALKPYYENSEMSQRMGDALSEMTSGERHSLYVVGMQIWKTSPVFGIGFQGFAYYHGGNYYSHATLIEVPVSGGAVGMLIYLCAYFSIAKEIIRRIRGDRRRVSMPDQMYYQHRMALIMLSLLLINFVCIIHPYQLDSNVNFGLAVALCYGPLNERSRSVVKK